MNFYTPTDYERQLSESPHNIEILSLLEKKSITRLQIIYVKDKNFIKSISDHYCNLRMIVFSFLVKLHYSYSSDNQRRFDKFKQFVYEAKLEKLTKNRGLQRQQLLKNIAVNLKKIPLGEQCQGVVLHLFNMVSYFDQVMMCALVEKFQSELQINNIDCIAKFLKDELDLTIIWTDQDVRFQTSHDIFLKMKDNNILRYSIGTSANLESDIQSIMSSQTPNQVQRLKLLQTISMQSGSPSPMPKKQQASHQKRLQSSKLKKNIRKQKENSSNFWACFCCKSFD